MRGLLWLALAGCSLEWSTLAVAAPDAQMPPPSDIANRNMITIALGPALVPDYEGSNDYRIIPAAAVQGKYHGISFYTQGAYLYVDVLPNNGKLDLDFGPIAGIRFNGRRNIKDEVVELLPRRNRALEVGAFGGISFHGLTNPYDSLALHLDVTYDIGNAHKSTILTPNATFSTPLSRRTYASLTVGAEFVSKKFADYYYTITPADSLATGGVLPAFDANGGMKNWKAGLMVNQSLTGDLLGGLSIFGYTEYSRLAGDFKRSPIVSLRGSPNQWTLATGLAYTW